MKRKAFTLAEVLITLMIIGVIAAMTVPTLKKSAEQQEMAAGCIKAYSTLANAVNRMTMDYGTIGRGADWTNVDTFTNHIVQYLNVTKRCKVASGTEGEEGYDPGNADECFVAKRSTSNPKGAERLDGQPADYAIVNDNTFVTSDSISYNYWKPEISDTGENQYGIAPADYKNTLGRFMVDVNGPKPPNVQGYDIYFFFLVKKKGVVPAGAASYSDCNKSGKGLTCAAYVLENKRVFK